MRFAQYLFPFVFLLFLICSPVFAMDTGERNQYGSILSKIFNFQFDKAKAKINTSTINQQDQKFLKIELNWWEAIEKNDKQALRDFYEKLKGYRETEKQAGSYMNLIINTYTLRYHMAVKNYPACALEYFRIKEIMNNHTRSENADNLSEHLFMLYSNLIELAELSYNFNPFTNDIDERKEKHIQQIKQHTESENFIRSTLGHYFLYKYFNDLAEDERKAEFHRIVLHERFPYNPFFSEPEKKFNQILTKNTK